MGRIPAVSCSFASLWILKIKSLQFECEVVCRALLAVLLQISSAVWVPTMCADWGCYNLGSILCNCMICGNNVKDACVLYALYLQFMEIEVEQTSNLVIRLRVSMVCIWTARVAFQWGCTDLGETSQGNCAVWHLGPFPKFPRLRQLVAATGGDILQKLHETRESLVQWNNMKEHLCFFVANLIERNQNLWGTRWAQEKTAHLLCSHRHFRSHQPLFPVKYEFDVSRAKKGLCSMTGVTLATLGTCQFDILRSDLKEDEVSWTHSYKCLACNKLIRSNTYQQLSESCPCASTSINYRPLSISCQWTFLQWPLAFGGLDRGLRQDSPGVDGRERNVVIDSEYSLFQLFSAAFLTLFCLSLWFWYYMQSAVAEEHPALAMGKPPWFL